MFEVQLISMCYSVLPHFWNITRKTLTQLIFILQKKLKSKRFQYWICLHPLRICD